MRQCGGVKEGRGRLLGAADLRPEVGDQTDPRADEILPGCGRHGRAPCSKQRGTRASAARRGIDPQVVKADRQEPADERRFGKTTESLSASIPSRLAARPVAKTRLSRVPLSSALCRSDTSRTQKPPRDCRRRPPPACGRTCSTRRCRVERGPDGDLSAVERARHPADAVLKADLVEFQRLVAARSRQQTTKSAPAIASRIRPRIPAGRGPRASRPGARWRGCAPPPRRRVHCPHRPARRKGHGRRRTAPDRAESIGAVCRHRPRRVRVPWSLPVRRANDRDGAASQPGLERAPALRHLVEEVQLWREALRDALRQGRAPASTRMPCRHSVSKATRRSAAANTSAVALLDFLQRVMPSSRGTTRLWNSRNE